MATTAALICDKAAVLLNDAAKSIWTNDILLPHIIDAFDELVQRLQAVGAQTVREESSVISVAAAATTVTCPTDMIEPLTLSERTYGTTDTFAPMMEVDWIPELTPTTMLRYWQNREQGINVLACTERKEVKIQYLKGLTLPTISSSVIDINNSTRFLQYRTAAIAAGFRGENLERAKYLNAIADDALGNLERAAIRAQQGMPARRIPYKSNRGL